MTEVKEQDGPPATDAGPVAGLDVESTAATTPQQREAVLRSILNTVPDGLIVIDRHGIIRSFSPAAGRMFGYTAAEAVGRNISMLMPRSHAISHDAYIDRYVATGERRIIGIGRVVAGLRKDGTTFPMELEIGEAITESGRLFTGFVRDITMREDRERRLADLQAELVHMSRLSELGQMVSALAHEVDQPLTAITNYAQGMRRMLTKDVPAPLHEAIEKMAAQAARAHAIVQSLRGMVRKEASPAQEANLATMIAETSAIAMIGAGRSIDVDLQVAPDAPRAWIDKVQIQQVLLNLMRNAVEAMEGAPRQRLTVATARRGDRVEISVADTGPGLPDMVKERLFQPFVTTKSSGLGVGLSICRAIVQAHGGELAATEIAEGGTVFRFTVPATCPPVSDSAV